MSYQTTTLAKEISSPKTEIDSPHIPEHARTRCLVYTRVMGYHRPVESFNTGKQGEHHERLHFKQA